MLRTIILILFFLSVTIACTGGKEKDVQQEQVETLEKEITYPITISLQDAIKNMDKNIKLSTFVENVEYIPLKLPTPIENLQLYDYDEEKELFFIAGTAGKILVLDKTGKFLNYIGRIGQGPGESPDIATVSVDKKNKYIYIYSAKNRTVLRYDYHGKFLKKMFSLLNNPDIPYVSDIYYNENNFIAESVKYLPNYESIKGKLFGYAVVDTLGNCLHKTASQVSQFDTSKGRYFLPMTVLRNKLTRYMDHLLLTTTSVSDTIFSVDKGKLIPRFFLDYGDEKPELQRIADTSKSIDRSNYIYQSIYIMNPAFETSRYFFTKFRKRGIEYIVVFDKFTNATVSVTYDYSKIEDPTKRGMVPIEHLGFDNDLDGGVDAYPLIESTEGNYWVSGMDAWQMKELLTDEHFSNRGSVKYPEQLAKVKQMVEQMDEEDDQILILMKLKQY